MPHRRIMADAVILCDGTIGFFNGAEKGLAVRGLAVRGRGPARPRLPRCLVPLPPTTTFPAAAAGCRRCRRCRLSPLPLSDAAAAAAAATRVSKAGRAPATLSSCRGGMTSLKRCSAGMGAAGESGRSGEGRVEETRHLSQVASSAGHDRWRGAVRLWQQAPGVWARHAQQRVSHLQLEPVELPAARPPLAPLLSRSCWPRLSAPVRPAHCTRRHCEEKCSKAENPVYEPSIFNPGTGEPIGRIVSYFRFSRSQSIINAKHVGSP